MSSSITTTSNSATTCEIGKTEEQLVQRIKLEEYEMNKWFASYSDIHNCGALRYEAPAYLAQEDGTCDRAICEIVLFAAWSELNLER